MKSSTVTKTTPTHSASRTSAFEYFPANGLLKAEIVEPGTQSELRTDYLYDKYGNKFKVTVKDSSQAPNWLKIPVATSTTIFDYAGLASNSTYTVISKNAVGHKETKVIDARYGVAKNLTGPNNLPTSWIYDGFGRKRVENRADGTQTEWIRNWCDSATPCADSRAIFQITKKEGRPGSAQAGSPEVTQNFDTLSREIHTITSGFTGQEIHKLTKYDNRGRLKTSRALTTQANPKAGRPTITMTSTG